MVERRTDRAQSGVLLEATGLAKRIGNRTLFEDLTLAVEPGERLRVKGASGSGKTTLLRLLARLDPLDSATTLLLDRKPAASWSVPEWRSRVLYVSQAVPTFPDTPQDTWHATEALAVYAGESLRDPADAALEWSLERSFWTQPWSELSGGERQRVALAMALACEPWVLLLDEPTSALDSETARAVEASLVELSKSGTAILWVTHDDAQAARVTTRQISVGG